MEAENFSSVKVEAGGEDKALGRDCTQHQLIKLAGEKEEERREEKEKDIGKKEEKGMKRNGTRMGPSMLVKEMISSHAICKLIITINTVNMPGTQHQLIKLAGEKEEESDNALSHAIC